MECKYSLNNKKRKQASKVNRPAAYRENKVLSTPNPDAGNAVVIVNAKDADAGESILAQPVKSLEHARHQVARHEDLCELWGVLVLGKPDGVAFWVKVLPEMRDGLCLGIFVAVATLESIKVPRTA